MWIHRHWRTLLAVAVAFVATVLAVPVWAQAPLPARLTLVDGPVQLLRGTQRFDVRAGQALADDDIVRTGADTGVARIEWADGRALDLGPRTQVLLPSPRSAAAMGVANASAVLAQGWAKLSAGTAPARLATTRVVMAAEPRGSVLARTADDGAVLAFAESRRVALLARGAETGAADQVLREGEGWRLDAGTADGELSSRAAVLRDVPRALADALPRRGVPPSAFEAAPEGGAPIDAADLRTWQRAEPAWVALMHAKPASWSRQRKAASLRTAGARAAAPARRVARAAPAATFVSSLPLPVAVSPRLAAAPSIDNSAMQPIGATAGP